MKQTHKRNVALIAIIIIIVAITAGVIGWTLAKNSQPRTQQATVQPTTQTQQATSPKQATTPKNNFAAIANTNTQFDACGKKEKYQNLAWWNNFKNSVAQINFYSQNYIESQVQSATSNDYLNPKHIKYTFDTLCADENYSSYDICVAGKNKKLAVINDDGNDLEGCLSKDGNLFIVDFPGVYMGGGSYVFRYDIRNNILEEAKRTNEQLGKVWVAVPREFLNREGNVIKMKGTEGDAGGGIENNFDYNFIDNQVKLTKSCPIGEGANKHQCTTY